MDLGLLRGKVDASGYTDIIAFTQLSAEDDTRNRHHGLYYGYERQRREAVVEFDGRAILRQTCELKPHSARHIGGIE